MLSKKPWFQDIDDLFSNKWVSFATADTAFPMDIIERDGEYEVKVAVPGVDKENLSVTIEKGNLHIQASSKVQNKTTETEKYVLRGLKAYEYKRVIPNIAEYNVVANKIKSVYKDGILSITLPKAEEEKPTTIEVKVE